jgi:hypothetical protein
MENQTELDRELIEKANAKKEQFISDMVKYKVLTDLDDRNDYPFFLYLASIMNFVEYHNGGCLTEWGMKSLELDISTYIEQLQTGEPKLSQKDLVRFLLNLLNSYAVSFLVKGLFELAKEEPEKFFELNVFPSSIKDDFDKLEVRVSKVLENLKTILDVYCPSLEGKYKTIFLEEKTKGFIKPIFEASSVKIKANTFPSDLANAKECK